MAGQTGASMRGATEATTTTPNRTADVRGEIEAARAGAGTADGHPEPRHGTQEQPRRDSGARPAPRPGSRRVKLTVSRIDPWSAMKMSFLLSVAVGIAGVVMVAVLWMILSGMGVFSEVNRLLAQIMQDSENPFDLMDYVGFGRVLSLAIVIGVIDVILLTALSTLSAFLYNVCASLVGGLQLTLTDD